MNRSFYQRNSWAPLLCNEDIFRQIVSCYLVHPNFIDFLLSFGEKHDEKDEDMFGGYFCHLPRDDIPGDPNECPKRSFRMYPMKGILEGKKLNLVRFNLQYTVR